MESHRLQLVTKGSEDSGIIPDDIDLSPENVDNLLGPMDAAARRSKQTWQDAKAMAEEVRRREAEIEAAPKRTITMSRGKPLDKASLKLE